MSYISSFTGFVKTFTDEITYILHMLTHNSIFVTNSAALFKSRCTSPNATAICTSAHALNICPFCHFNPAPVAWPYAWTHDRKTCAQ